MKAIYLPLCLMLILAGTLAANSGYDGYYDDDYYYEDYDYYYDDYGGYGCCCAPVFALLAIGAFAFQRQ